MDIRKATIDDAEGIARNVMAAMDFDVFTDEQDDEIRNMLAAMTEICAREDTLYSWKNTIVACEDGVMAGSLTSYDGGEYHQMRELTFGLLQWTPPTTDYETKAGEWYMDSLAVSPSFRRKGIARLLMSQALEIAEGLGFTKISLIALAGSDRLISYYESFGFTPEGHVSFFGHDYLRMMMYI